MDVTGEVVTPGDYNLKSHLPLMQLLDCVPGVTQTTVIILRVLVSRVIRVTIPACQCEKNYHDYHTACYDGPSTNSPLLPLLLPNSHSIGFTVTCTLRCTFCCCASMALNYTEMASPLLNDVIVDSSDVIKFTLPHKSVRCSPVMCLVRLVSTKSIRVDVDQLTLPDIDHYYDCVHEGLAIYETRKHNQLYPRENTIPIVRLCSKIRLLRGHDPVVTSEEYPVTSLTSTENSLVVALYSYHGWGNSPRRKFASVLLSITQSGCQGLYITCHDVHQLSKVKGLHDMSLHMYDPQREYKMDVGFYYRPPGYHRLPDYGPEITVVQPTAQLLSYGNVSHTANVLGMYESRCVTVQYVTHVHTGFWYTGPYTPPSTVNNCLLTLYRIRDVGPNNLAMSSIYRKEYCTPCNDRDEGLVFRPSRVYTPSEPVFHSSETQYIGKLSPPCLTFTVDIRATPHTHTHVTHADTIDRHFVKSLFNTYLADGKTYMHYYSHNLKHHMTLNASSVSTVTQYSFGNKVTYVAKGSLVPPQCQSVIDVWSTGCDVTLTVHVLYDLIEKDVAQNHLYISGPLYSYYHHVSVSSTLLDGILLSVLEPYFYTRRYVFLQPTSFSMAKMVDNATDCKLHCIVDICHPYGETQSESRSGSMSESRSQSRSKPLTNPLPLTLPQIYLFWQVYDISWGEAESVCAGIGGHLPSITSQEEFVYYEDVIRGRFNPDMLYRNPCRWYTVVCPYFIGLNLQVGYIHIIQIMYTSNTLG